MYRYNKYGNRKTTVDGRTFDSKKEAERYIQLRTLEHAGRIEGLECQKKFVLVPAQREPDTVSKTGKPVKGKIIEREVAYFADFVYYDKEHERFVAEDVKGFRTAEYRIKRALMLERHNIRIREV